jgi:hypothetical protein
MKKRDPRKEFDALFQPNRVIIPAGTDKRKLLESIRMAQAKKKLKDYLAKYDITKQKCKICQKQATRCSLRNGIFIHFCKEHAPEDAGRYLND